MGLRNKRSFAGRVIVYIVAKNEVRHSIQFGELLLHLGVEMSLSGMNS